MRESGFVSIGPNLEKSTGGISGMPAPAAGAPAATVAAAALGPFRKAMTSSLVIRPFSPVPLIFVRSTVSSRAMRRTLGLAWTCPKSAAGARSTGAAGAGAAADSAAGAGAAVTGCGVGGGSCWLISDGGGVMAPSPACKRRIGLPSLTRSPTLTSSRSTVPPDGAGTSMVALSDSRVTRGSSASIASPSFTWTSMIGTSLKSPMSGTLTSFATPVSSRCRAAGLDGAAITTYINPCGTIRQCRSTKPWPGWVSQDPGRTS